MNINEYLELTREEYKGTSYGGIKIRPRIICANGFGVSIQASDSHYCTPRNNYGPYLRVEIGYPSDEVPEWRDYAENKVSLTILQKLKEWFMVRILKKRGYLSYYPTNTVYGFVPIEIVNAVLESYGGIANGVEGW